LSLPILHGNKAQGQECLVNFGNPVSEKPVYRKFGFRESKLSEALWIEATLSGSRRKYLNLGAPGHKRLERTVQSGGALGIVTLALNRKGRVW